MSKLIIDLWTVDDQSEQLSSLFFAFIEFKNLPKSTIQPIPAIGIRKQICCKNAKLMAISADKPENLYIKKAVVS